VEGRVVEGLVDGRDVDGRAMELEGGRRPDDGRDIPPIDGRLLDGIDGRRDERLPTDGREEEERDEDPRDILGREIELEREPLLRPIEGREPPRELLLRPIEGRELPRELLLRAPPRLLPPRPRCAQTVSPNIRQARLANARIVNQRTDKTFIIE
jgi:hypothetical protein